MAKEDNTLFVNPLKEGVSYNDFIKALGTKTVKEYLSNGKKEDGSDFTEAEIKWLTDEVKAHKYNEENKAEFEKIHKQEAINLNK